MTREEREKRKSLLKENIDIIEDLDIRPVEIDYLGYLDDDTKKYIETDLKLNTYEKKFVLFENLDTISAAIKHYDKKGIDFLVFASEKNYGGGVWNGSKAQEEDIFLATDLQMIKEDIQKEDYPLKGILTIDCHIIRNGFMQVLDIPVPARAFFAAAPNKASGKEQTPDLYTRICTLTEATFDNHKGSTLVIGAWGCGVFRNDPVEVAGLFRHLMPLFQEDYKHIVVAIPDKEMLDIFKKTLLD